MNKSNRMNNIGEYLFDQLYAEKNNCLNNGINVFDLALGVSNYEPDAELKTKLSQLVLEEGIHDYPNMDGEYELLESIAEFYHDRFAINVDPKKEILILHGSKEGLAKVAMTYSDYGDFVMVPNPSYPIYEHSAHLNGNKIIELPLKRDNNFQPDFAQLTSDDFSNTKIIFLNYPNVPTSATTDSLTFASVLDISKEFNCLIVNDATYSNIFYDDSKKPISIFEIDKAKQYSIEFNSFSQMFGIAGWRLGFVIGNEENIKVLKKTETILDSGAFIGFQKAASFALNNYSDLIYRRNSVYKEGRDILSSGLKKLGFNTYKSDVTYYSWVEIPSGIKSIEMSKRLLKEANVLCAPGIGFGKYGENYIRFCYSRKHELIEEAVEAISKNIANIL